jgi:hypothetical protein
MTDLEELNRIDAAILPRNQTELLWAQDYCRTQMRAAIPNEDKGRWKRLQRDVGRVLRELRVTDDHISAHEWSSYHRETLRESEVCGCFYCLEVFPPREIEDWTDDDDTALCPKCGIDSVIGSVSGYPIERQFLQKMHDHWF